MKSALSEGRLTTEWRAISGRKLKRKQYYSCALEARRVAVLNPAGPVIWVVEDDVSTQRIVAQNLKQHGFNPILFDTAEKAYAALQIQALPALIILDMLLPGMSGVDLIRLIKHNDTWSRIPVVVVTVLSRDDNPGMEEAAEAYWVNKPFDANNLIQTIQNILATAKKD